MGCIYLLYDNEGRCYVGKTNNIENRLVAHRKKSNRTRSRYLNKNFKCEVIVECDDEDELAKLEQTYFDYYKDSYGDKCVNYLRPLQTSKEYYETNKERITEKTKEWRETHKEELKEYYENNKEKISQQRKEWRETHKEELKEKNKEWRETHKEQISERHKKYREKNKEQILEDKKQYYEENKEQILEHKKEYYETHKEQHNKVSKEYYEKNKEAIAKQKKEYRETNKEAIAEKNNQKITCECGSVVRYGEKSRHAKTNKHQNYLRNLLT